MLKSCPASAARESHDIMTLLYHLANSVELAGIFHDYEDDEFKSKSIRRSALFLLPMASHSSYGRWYSVPHSNTFLIARAIDDEKEQ